MLPSAEYMNPLTCLLFSLCIARCQKALAASLCTSWCCDWAMVMMDHSPSSLITLFRIKPSAHRL